VTLIKEGTKIDNLVQVAHNCTVGEHSILVSQVGLAGSVTLGHHVVLAGQVGVGDHVMLGDQVTLTARSGTFRDVESNSVVSGFPVVPNTQWKREIASLPKLPDLIKQVRKLKARLDAME
jgi:UDP-3-O-[3-hydroxymyristoyl] glucosamine N-acyltransferase